MCAAVVLSHSLLLQLAATACCYSLLLQLAATACCYSLLLQLAATACCYSLLLQLAAEIFPQPISSLSLRQRRADENWDSSARPFLIKFSGGSRSCVLFDTRLAGS